MYRDRHLGTIRSNIDKGWKPSIIPIIIKFLLMIINLTERNPSTTMDDFFSYRGTINSPRSFGFNTNNNRRNKIDFGNPTAELPRR